MIFGQHLDQMLMPSPLCSQDQEITAPSVHRLGCRLVAPLLALNEMCCSVHKEQLSTQMIYVHFHAQPQKSCRQRSYSALCLHYSFC